MIFTDFLILQFVGRSSRSQINSWELNPKLFRVSRGQARIIKPSGFRGPGLGLYSSNVYPGRALKLVGAEPPCIGEAWRPDSGHFLVETQSSPGACAPLAGPRGAWPPRKGGIRPKQAGWEFRV